MLLMYILLEKYYLMTLGKWLTGIIILGIIKYQKRYLWLIFPLLLNTFYQLNYLRHITLINSKRCAKYKNNAGFVKLF
ncbi:hypothetical protein D9F30_24405 [Escherichia coli]|nr:hypothetical protein [Escherichia coli]